MRIYNILYMNIMYKNWMYMSTEIECWRTRANYLLRALAVCWCTATAVLRCSNCSILTCKITLSSWRKTFLCSVCFEARLERLTGGVRGLTLTPTLNITRLLRDKPRPPQIFPSYTNWEGRHQEQGQNAL